MSRAPRARSKRSPPPKNLHFGSFFDPVHCEPVWCIERTAFVDRVVVRKVPEYARRTLRMATEADGTGWWQVDHQFGDEVLEAIGNSARSKKCFCDLCVDGCEVRLLCQWSLRKVSAGYVYRDSNNVRYRTNPTGRAGSPYAWERLELDSLFMGAAEEFLNKLFGTFFGGSFNGIPGGEIPRMSMDEAAALLCVTMPCGRDEVIVAFRKKALETHPDRGGDPEAFKKAVEARDVLMALVPT